MRRVLLGLEAVALTMLLFAAPSAAAAHQKPTLGIAIFSAPINLDPSRAGNGTTAMFQDPAYGSLLHLVGGGGTESPSLAKSFNWVGDNNTELKVVLRSGLRFSDGSPLNAAAVEASAQHFATGQSAGAYAGQEIASMSTPNAETIVFKLKAPDPTFPNELAETTGLGMIISPKAISSHENLGTATDGAGPYELSPSQTIEGSTYTYVPNPYYPAKSAIKYAKIVMRVIADPNTALAALESGQVQVVEGTASVTGKARSAGLGVASFPSGVDALYLFDHGAVNPALGNLDVRKAMNYAIDRPVIARALTLGTGKPTDQLASPGSIGYDANLEKTYPYDLAKAKALMAKAGYRQGFVLTVEDPTFLPTSDELATILASQLAKIGVTLQLTQATSIGQFVQAGLQTKFDATVFDLSFPVGIASSPSLLFNANALGNPNHQSFPALLSGITTASALGGARGAAAWKNVSKLIVTQALEVPVDSESYDWYYAKSVKGVGDSLALDPIYFTPARS